MEYPKYLYRWADSEQGFEAVLLKNEEQEKALPEGYVDSPAKVQAPTYKEHMAEWESKEEKKKRPKKEAK